MDISEKIKLSFRRLGLQVKKLREERDISIKELSIKTGISRKYLEKIENGNAYGIKLERHLDKIAKNFDVKLSELFNFD